MITTAFCLSFIKQTLLQAHSLYISPAMNHLYGTENEIWAGFALVGSSENFELGYFLRAIFDVFMGIFFFKNIIASDL